MATHNSLYNKLEGPVSYAEAYNFMCTFAEASVRVKIVDELQERIINLPRRRILNAINTELDKIKYV